METALMDKIEAGLEEDKTRHAEAIGKELLMKIQRTEFDLHQARKKYNEFLEKTIDEICYEYAGYQRSMDSRSSFTISSGAIYPMK